MKSKIFDNLRDYNKDLFVRDIIAGIIVAIVSIPISLSIAIASGISPEKGLYTSIVAGIFMAIFGSGKLSIGGMSIAFITIAPAITASYGTNGIVVTGLLAGIILILMGVFKLGTLVKLIPYAITLGFTSAIALILLVSQINEFFGFQIENLPYDFIPRLILFIRNSNNINNFASFIGILTIVIYFVFKKLQLKFYVPYSIVAIVVTSIITAIFRLPINTIGSIYGDLKNQFISWQLPVLSIPIIRNLIPHAITLAAIISMESLLASIKSDEVTKEVYDSNGEVFALGISNFCSIVCGGLPVSVSYPSTDINIKSGARTNLSGIFHSLFIALALSIFIPLIRFIPLATLSAIMIIISIEILDIKSIMRFISNSTKSDKWIFIATFFLTIVFDLVIAIEFGFISTALIFLGKLSDNVNIRKWKRFEELSEEERKQHSIDFPKGIEIIDIEGPLYYASANKIASMDIEKDTKAVIYRMSSVTSLDAYVAHALRIKVANIKLSGAEVIFSHVQEKPYNMMLKEGIVDDVGEGNIKSNIKDALNYAISKL